MLKDRILSEFFLHERIKPAITQFEEKVKNGGLTTSKAIEELLNLYKET
jgi:LAO/AO transport system kinase